MLPPIRTENKETEEYLLRIKKEIGETTNKSLRLERELNKVLTSKREAEQKIKFYKEYKNTYTSRIVSRSNILEWVQYENEVLKNMKKSLKQINYTLHKQKLEK